MFARFAAWIAAFSIGFAGVLLGQDFQANHYFCTSATGDSIREFDPNGMLVRELGAGQGISGALSPAFGPDGCLYVINSGTASIYKFDSSGQKTGEFGAIAGLVSPSSLAFGAGGHLFVTSLSPDRIVEFDEAGVKVRDLAEGQGIQSPGALAIGADSHLFVASTGTNSVFELDREGNKIREFTDISLSAPSSIHLGPDGNLFVLSTAAARIFVFRQDGILDRTMGADLDWLSPVLMQPGPDGNIYVLDAQRIRVYVINGFGKYVRHMDGVFDALTPAGVALSPIRFTARVTGGRAKSGNAQGLLRENATISYFPGTGTAMLQIKDVANTNDLASLFGCTQFVFRGPDRFVSADPVARTLDGIQSPGTGVSSISLQSFGVIDAGGAYSPLRMKGTLHCGSGAAVFAGSISTILRIN